MSHIKEDLKDLVQNTMIPEIEDYLDDLHKILEKKEETEDDMLAIKEMESLLVDLQNVLAVIEEDKTEDSEYQRIYDYIVGSLEKKHD
ncbi:hypothetical protein [Poseidonibacter sp.]|uniref:hypothetical protein n=1 Tax=Poseidonibacter sp. TaxID=2321188 RepID=UPI00359DE504